MDKEQMVKNAVELAKMQGVQFRDGSLSFRPASGQQKIFFNVIILTNTSLNTAGHASLDQHFDILTDIMKKD